MATCMLSGSGRVVEFFQASNLEYSSFVAPQGTRMVSTSCEIPKQRPIVETYAKNPNWHKIDLFLKISQILAIPYETWSKRLAHD